MSDEQVRGQLLGCLERVQRDLEEAKQHSSAVMVEQARELIEAQAIKLEQSQRHADGFEEDVTDLLCERNDLKAERDEALRRVDRCREALRNIAGWAYTYRHDDGTFEEDKQIPFDYANEAIEKLDGAAAVEGREPIPQGWEDAISDELEAAAAVETPGTTNSEKISSELVSEEQFTDER